MPTIVATQHGFNDKARGTTKHGNMEQSPAGLTTSNTLYLKEIMLSYHEVLPQFWRSSSLRAGQLPNPTFHRSLHHMHTPVCARDQR